MVGFLEPLFIASYNENHQHVSYKCDGRQEGVRYTGEDSYSGAPNEEKMGKGLQCSFLISRVVLWSFKVVFVRANTI